jgi:aminotransferase
MRDLCVTRLNSMAGVHCVLPEGCYVAFPAITGTGLSSGEMQELLFNEARVAVVPGLPEWFGDGADGHIRLSFATSEEILTQAMERIQNTIQRI